MGHNFSPLLVFSPTTIISGWYCREALLEKTPTKVEIKNGIITANELHLYYKKTTPCMYAGGRVLAYSFVQ